MNLRLIELRDALLLGKPDKLHHWTEQHAMAAGEALRAMMDEAHEGEAANDELLRIEQILIAFGVLEDGDKSTGLADLVEALLPPSDEP